MIAMAKLLASLHDDAGDVAVPGVSTEVWSGADLTEEEFRDSADVLDGVELVGTGPVAARLFAKPSVSVIGLDMTSVVGSSNVLIPQVAAKISMRIVPGSDPDKELDALVSYLESSAPWGAQVDVRRTKAAPPFRCDSGGPAYAAARTALEAAFGKPVSEAGSGASIPLLRTLQTAAPRAEFILWGPEDVAGSRIHASDESVDPSEIERCVVAQSLLLQQLAETWDATAV
jgi:acetylornithine deacetylase/succinyl-diaminopimelate desuccinylase-like protein